MYINSINTQEDFIPVVDGVKLYFNSVSKYPILTEQEERQLFAEMANGDESAREKILNSNLRLVISVAKRYKSSNLSMLDLIQEGNAGLITAINKYDITTGYKFSTYAVWWIRQAISKAVNDNKSYHIPMNIVTLNSQINKATDTFTQQNGQEPTLTQLSEILNISEKKIKDAKSYFQSECSLDTPVGDKEDNTLGSLLEDKDNLSPEESYEMAENASELKKAIDKVLSSLSEREREVIRIRFGLDTRKEKTLEETGKILGITGERVRQIEKEALSKLRFPLRSKILKEFYI